MPRKIFCIFVLLSLVLSTSACGGGNNERAGDAQSFYYQETELGSDSGLTDPAGFRINSQNQLVFCDQTDENSFRYVILSNDGKPTGDINVDIIGKENAFALGTRDNLYIAAITQSPGAEGEQKLYFVDKSGKITKTIDLGKVSQDSGKGQVPEGVMDIAAGSDGNIYLADPSKGILVLDKNGSQIKTIGSPGVARIAVGKDNIMYSGNQSQNGLFLEKIDISTGRSVWKQNIEKNDGYQDMKYSLSDNSIYLLGVAGIDKFDAEGKESGRALTFSDYTVLASGELVPAFQVDTTGNIYTISVSQLEDTKAGGKASTDKSASGSSTQERAQCAIFKYTLKSGTNGNENKKTITVSVRRSERYLETAASLFQKDNPGFRIKLVYPGDSDDVENYMKNLNTNILAGKGPDIIQMNWLPVEKYTSKGILAGLDELIAMDKSFDVSQYYTNILDGMKQNGHMYFMPTEFSFNALLANKCILDEAGITIDSGKWTWDDFKTIAEKVVQKDGSGNITRNALPNVSSADLLTYFMMFGDFSKFTDMEKKTSSFDSPDFVKMLEMSKTFGNGGITSEGGFKRGMADVMEAAYRGAVVFLPQPIQDYMFYGVAKALFNGKVSVLGFPSENGAAFGTFSAGESYGITSYSKYKDEAWKFIKILISEEIQSNMDSGGFSVNKAAQKKLADQAMERTASGNAKLGIAGMNIEVGKITQDDINYIDSLISGLNRYYQMDAQIQQIITDETTAFFKGDKSVEDTAKLIQDKVYTYLNE